MARDGLFPRGKNKIWTIRTDPVTGKQLSTRCKDREAARRFLARRERLAADPAHAAAETARLDEWIRRVIAVKESDGSSSATVEVYRTKLGHWLRLAPDALLSQVDPGFVDSFVAARREEEVSDHTISKEVTHLCTVLKAAKHAGCYPGDIATLRPPGLHAGYKPRKRALSREEVMRLLSELKPELGALVAICVALGCRLSEAYRLLPSDIDWAKNRVFIDGRKTEESARYVPILSLFSSLLAACAKTLPLGKEPNNLRRDLAAACTRARIAKCTPNDLRRTHATLLAEAGVDRDVTRRLLGHTTTRLVDTVYGQPSTEALGALAEQRLAALPPLLEISNDLQRTPQDALSGHDGHPDTLDKEKRESAGDVDANRTDPAALPAVAVATELAGRSVGVVTRVTGGATNSLQQTGSATGAVEKHRADFEIRTRDLRFTKPNSVLNGDRLSEAKRRFPLLSTGELLRSGATDDRKPRTAVTDPRQLRGAL